jgi:hypothetical protein
MTTEQRTGFRLPWSSDRSGPSDAPDAAPDAARAAAPEGPAAEGSEESAPDPAAMLAEVEPEAGDSSVADDADSERPGALEWPETDTAAAAAWASRAESPANEKDDNKSEADSMSTAHVDPPAVAPPLAAPAIPGPTRPTRLLVEMSRAMQAAAQAERDETVARLAAESKGKIEAIQAQGSSGTTELRRRADDDVAATREWSKAEIARIREETEHRIADRKAQLEADVERHAASIKRRIELVREAVAHHEAELAAFIDRLMAEDDPARIATLAQEVPEPPLLDELDEGWVEDAEDADLAARDAAMVGASHAGRSEPGPRAVTRVAPADDVDGESPDADAEGGNAADDDDGRAAARGSASVSDEADDDAADVDADAADAHEREIGDAADQARGTRTPDEPRLSAAGAAAAEAEALAGLDGDDDPAGVRVDHSAVPAGGVGRTELLVSGLGSVAGIAGFKRELSRLPGVRSVGVSAGEAGQFVFAVSHDTGVDVGAGIPTIAAFGAQLTGQRTGTLLVTASEPTTTD